MREIVRLLGLVGVLSVTSSNVVAGSESVLQGAGVAVRCGDWSEGRKSAADSVSKFKVMAVQNWVSGFLSGVNSYSDAEYGKSVFYLPSPDLLNQMMDKNCSDDPMKQTWVAALQIAGELRKKNPVPK